MMTWIQLSLHTGEEYKANSRPDVLILKNLLKGRPRKLRQRRKGYQGRDHQE
jgi:hypothetical protein